MRKQYVCKRLRMLEFLRNRGFYPVATIPDMNNPKYNIWLFDWTDEFEEAKKEYFDTQTLTKH